MKNQSKNDFKAKFQLLNSQENSEDIIWSCSDSSEYENLDQNENLGKANHALNRKRKRVQTRKKALKNISNLNITFTDTPVEHKDVDKSVSQKVVLSPILRGSQQHFAPINDKKVLSSPILSSKSKKSNFNQINIVKSPILILKHTSPKISPNVRKNLFNNNIENNNNNIIENKLTNIENGRSTSPVFICSQTNKKSRHNSAKLKNSYVNNDFKPCCESFNKHSKQEIIKSDNINKEQSRNNKNADLNKSVHLKGTRVKVDENLNDTLSSKTAGLNLLEKVKSYFDSHFSSETPSQQSISECDTTPKNSSKTSEEIEIMNSQTDKKCMPQVIKLENKSSSDSLRSYDFQAEKSKRLRYKKDGLAYRLSALLKKQKANTCLWQHERFLAANSNFVLPNDDFTAFRIQNVTFKYGCHLLKVIDVEGNIYFVVINHLNMTNSNLEECNIFKLYKPFKILDFNSNYKLIVNVTKFECAVIDR